MDRAALFVAVKFAVAVIAAAYVGRQVKKPTRFVGRLFARTMNNSHARLTDWSLTHLAMRGCGTALDVGCGGGRTIEMLAGKMTSVYGIDYAAGSVVESCAHNQRLIAEGKVFVERASVSQLPFSDNFFDLVTAIETQYYWPAVEKDMEEILRVMKPGGRLMVVAESYRGGRHDWLLGPIMRLLGSQRLRVGDHRALFRDTGYTAVEAFEERRKGWLCVIGQKPPT
jgi:SAM-dependent methyltransferase